MSTILQSFPNPGKITWSGLEIGITDSGWQMGSNTNFTVLEYEEIGDYVKDLFYRGHGITVSSVVKYASTEVLNLYFSGNIDFATLIVGDSMLDKVASELIFTPADPSRLGFNALKAVPRSNGVVNFNSQLMQIPLTFEVLYIDDSTPPITFTGGAS